MFISTYGSSTSRLTAIVLAVMFVLIPALIFAGGRQETPTELDVWDQPQSPALAALVQAGELPPLEERLPTNPKVVDPDEIGTYGGQGQGALMGATDGGWLTRSIMVDGLVHWDPEWTDPVPAGLARYDINDDATVFTLELREGLRWHDGELFTTADVDWWWNHEMLNQEITPTLPIAYTSGGEPGELEVVDDETFRFVFATPNPLFLDNMASGGAWNITAKHFGERFHADFNENVHGIAEAEGFDDWLSYYDYMTDPHVSSGLPRIHAWTVAEGEGYTGDNTRVRFIRNPYYYRVDTEGNQLPYIDEWVFDVFEDPEVILLRILAGEIDIHGRHHVVTPANRPIIFEGQERGDYRLYNMRGSTSATSAIRLNMTHDDETVREVARNRYFRIGLSLATNREEISDLLFAGIPRPRQVAPYETMPWYNEQLERQYLEYDVNLAREYFDRAGYEYDNSGKLIGPDGEQITLRFDARQQSVDTLEILQQQWREVGVEVEINVLDRSLWQQRNDRNQGEAYIGGGDGGLRDILTDPRDYFAFSEESRFAARWAAWYGNDVVLSAGVEPEVPPAAMRRQMELFDQVRISPPADHAELMSEILQIAADEFWIFAMTEIPQNYAIQHNRIHNGPPDAGSIWSWPLGDHGVYHWSERFIRDR